MANAIVKLRFSLHDSLLTLRFSLLGPFRDPQPRPEAPEAHEAEPTAEVHEAEPTAEVHEAEHSPESHDSHTEPETHEAPVAHAEAHSEGHAEAHSEGH